MPVIATTWSALLLLSRPLLAEQPRCSGFCHPGDRPPKLAVGVIFAVTVLALSDEEEGQAGG